MMYGVVLVVHILVSFLLIGVVLLQGGRGGMAEAMGGSAAQSLFGGGANVVMSRITAVGAGLFMVTCLSLAVLSTHRGRSVIDRLPMTLQEAIPIPAGAPDATAPASPSNPTPPSSGPTEPTAPPQ